MKRFRSSRIGIFFCFVLLFLYVPFSAGQEVSAAQAVESASELDSIDPLKIMVSVNEVRIDVVVLDKKGNQITDLTADDFEVFQDNKRQTITSGVYIDSQPNNAARTAATRKEAQNIPQFPTTALKKEDVRRTILFVVDDYALSFENGYYTKMALRNFVEKQMQTGDLVAIIRTDYGNRSLNMFLSDKREVFARINAMSSTKAMRLEDIEKDYMGDQVVRSREDSTEFKKGAQNAMKEYVARFQSNIHEKQITALFYSIDVMKNMPGRKILNMMTPFSTHSSDDKQEIFSHYRNLYGRLADEALRAGVVINYLDMDGLDASRGYRYIESQGYIIVQSFDNRAIPLPGRTGGVIIRDSNFFLSGIGKEAESLMKGYYLISYTPPPDTFETRDKKDVYHRLKVRVKRSGAVVHTRDGFFGKLESEPDVETTKNPLIEAIYSPFKQDDINVNIAAGYVKDAEAGYLVRSWIHLDPEDIKIMESEDGGARIDLETLFLASDIDGGVQDARYEKYTFTIEPENKVENIAWIKKHGIRFSLLLPVKKPGSYYVRIAVQEKESGKVGSAYQFLEIPDLSKKNMALSNIFMLTSADDLTWMLSDATKEIDKGVFFPMFQAEEVRSPALRTYLPGDNLQTLAMIYNADAKALARSEIETQTILYKDGVEFMRGEPTPITPDKVDNPGSIPLLNRLTVGTNMPPGDYVLQILATEKKNGKKKENVASQTLGFTVVEK